MMSHDLPDRPSPRGPADSVLGRTRPARLETSIPRGCLLLLLLISAFACADRSSAGEEELPRAGFLPLFPTDGVPAGWIVRGWNDVLLPAPREATWTVTNGILRGGVPRGTWLVSEREYGDMILEFECRLGERGQSGVGLRFPLRGEPSVEGLEVQMVDPRFYGTNYTGLASEYSGALYKAIAPAADAYKPLEWNHYRIECRGARITVTLNGRKVVDVNLAEQTDAAARGKPLAERPRRGRIGFQEVSRGGGQVEIRNARLQVLDGPA